MRPLTPILFLLLPLLEWACVVTSISTSCPTLITFPPCPSYFLTCSLYHNMYLPPKHYYFLFFIPFSCFFPAFTSSTVTYLSLFLLVILLLFNLLSTNCYSLYLILHSYFQLLPTYYYYHSKTTSLPLPSSHTPSSHTHTDSVCAWSESARLNSGSRVPPRLPLSKQSSEINTHAWPFHTPYSPTLTDSVMCLIWFFNVGIQPFMNLQYLSDTHTRPKSTKHIANPFLHTPSPPNTRKTH